jgi:hypothetical protein
MSFHNSLVGLAKQRKLSHDNSVLYLYDNMSQKFVRNSTAGTTARNHRPGNAYLDDKNLKPNAHFRTERSMQLNRDAHISHERLHGSKRTNKNDMGGRDDLIIDWSDVWEDYKAEFEKEIPPMWVSRPVGELVQNATKGIDSNYILKPEILPARRGFIWFDEPWIVEANHPTLVDEHGNMHEYMETLDPETMSQDEYREYPHHERLRAILYSHHDSTRFKNLDNEFINEDEMVPAINIYWLTECPIEEWEHSFMNSHGHDTFDLNAGIKEHVRYACALPYTVPVGTIAESLHEGDRQASNSEHILKSLIALFEFMNQKIVEIKSVSMPKKWSKQKRGMKLARNFDGNVPAIQLVRLRRKEVIRQKAIDDGIASGKLNVRFLVREHFRNQCYCSIHGTTEYIHHPKRIERYWKGPIDGELVNPEKVFTIDR